ncbi:MAG TPA: hypothetical protein VHM30_09700 [Gemmatimonadaceae bacterium]|nr:hypothetical protein [Gemmatimonadaceae bacterium]
MDSTVKAIMHRRPAPLITTWLIVGAAIWLLHWFGNWSPAYRELLPPIYAILAFVGVGYTLRWGWPRSREDRRHEERRHENRRHDREDER